MGNSLDTHNQSGDTEDGLEKSFTATMGLLNKIFKRDNNKDLKELVDSFEENKDEILQAFQQLSFKKEEGQKARIKMNDLTTFGKKLEEIIGHELDDLLEYVINQFSLRQTKYAISADDLLLALQHFVEYTKFVRENPQYLKRGMMSQESLEDIGENEPMRQKLVTAYTIRSQDPREQLRVKSLQLLCYKLASHNTKIQNLLDRYLFLNTPDYDDEKDDETTKSKRKIPLSKLAEVLKDFSLVTGIILIQYSQYINEEVDLKENDPIAISKFEQFFYLNLSIGDGMLRKPTIFKQSTTKATPDKVKKVKFLEDGIQSAKDMGLGFTKEFFIYQIDKFFSRELNIVLKPIDDEYEQYLHKQRLEEEEFQKTLDDLDDFFLAKTEPDKGISIVERDSQADQVLKLNKASIIIEDGSPEEYAFQNHLRTTIREYEAVLTANKFSRPQDKKDLQNMVNIMKAQLEQAEKSLSQRQSQKSLYGKGSKDELDEARKRGLMEIFHFYSRQHIPLNREFDDLKEIMDQVDLGEYMKFCTDFQVPLSKAKLTEIFKKCSVNHKSHKFEQFFSSMTRIGQEINKQKIEETTQKLKEIIKEIRKFQSQQRKANDSNALKAAAKEREQQNEVSQQIKQQIQANSEVRAREIEAEEAIEVQANKENNDENQQSKSRSGRSSVASNGEADDEQEQEQDAPEFVEGPSIQIEGTAQDDSNFYSITIANTYNNQSLIQEVGADNILIQEKNRLDDLRRELESKSDDQLRDDFLAFLECHDPNKYRKKIKGFHMAFNIREKSTRISEDEASKYKFKNKQSADEIKKGATEAKQKRQREKEQKEKDEKEKYQRDREALRKMHEQLRKERGTLGGQQIKALNDLKQRYGEDKNMQLTFAAIEKMHYTDFNSGNIAEDFKPSDIIDDDFNSSDDEILKNFKDQNKNRDLDKNPSDSNNTDSKNTISTINTINQDKIKVQPNLGDYQINGPHRKNMQSIDPVQEQIKNLKNTIDRISLAGPLSQRTKNNHQQFNSQVIQKMSLEIPQQQAHPQGNMTLVNAQTVRESTQDRLMKKRGGQVNQSELNSTRIKASLISDRSKQLPQLSPQRKLARQVGPSSTNNSKLTGLNQSVHYNNGIQGVQIHPNLQKISNSLDTQSYKQQFQPIIQSQEQITKRQGFQKGPMNLASMSKDSVTLQAAPPQGINRYQKQLPTLNQNPGNNSYYLPMKPQDAALSSRDQIINRAYQIEQMSKQNQERNMNNIMRMHEQQIKKGLNTVKK